MFSTYELFKLENVPGDTVGVVSFVATIFIPMIGIPAFVESERMLVAGGVGRSSFTRSLFGLIEGRGKFLEGKSLRV